LIYAAAPPDFMTPRRCAAAADAYAMFFPLTRMALCGADERRCRFTPRCFAMRAPARRRAAARRCATRARHAFEDLRHAAVPRHAAAQRHAAAERRRMRQQHAAARQQRRVACRTRFDARAADAPRRCSLMFSPISTMPLPFVDIARCRFRHSEGRQPRRRF